MLNTAPFFTALNTLRASRFTVMRAKMFGQKSVVSDSGCTITVHKWRGKWYLTDCKDEVPNTKGQTRGGKIGIWAQVKALLGGEL